MSLDRTHLVIIPSYNPGRRLVSTVSEALGAWKPVWVVSDASSDGSEAELGPLALDPDVLKVIVRPKNGGKGAAILTAGAEALRQGYTHALVMDADGQHPADRIGDFMAASKRNPAAMILGSPEFGPDAPWVRRNGRKLSVGLVTFELFGKAVEDPLFGFRVYPLEPLVKTMESAGGARRFDFDPEIAVRLTWAGVPAVNFPAKCRYLSRADGGVSHFRYVRDNLRMIWMHTRLITELLLFRWPAALRSRKARSR